MLSTIYLLCNGAKNEKNNILIITDYFDDNPLKYFTR